MTKRPWFWFVLAAGCLVVYGLNYFDTPVSWVDFAFGLLMIVTTVVDVLLGLLSMHTKRTS